MLPLAEHLDALLDNEFELVGLQFVDFSESYRHLDRGFLEGLLGEVVPQLDELLEPIHSATPAEDVLASGGHDLQVIERLIPAPNVRELPRKLLLIEALLAADARARADVPVSLSFAERARAAAEWARLAASEWIPSVAVGPAPSTPSLNAAISGMRISTDAMTISADAASADLSGELMWTVTWKQGETGPTLRLNVDLDHGILYVEAPSAFVGFRVRVLLDVQTPGSQAPVQHEAQVEFEGPASAGRGAPGDPVVRHRALPSAFRGGDLLAAAVEVEPPEVGGRRIVARDLAIPMGESGEDAPAAHAILKRGTWLPTVRELELWTVVDDQAMLGFPLLQRRGAPPSDDPEDYVVVADVHISLPPLPQRALVVVRIQVDAHGLLTMTAVVAGEVIAAGLSLEGRRMEGAHIGVELPDRRGVTPPPAR